MDTHYLPELRDELLEKLNGLQRLDEAKEVFEDVLRIEAKENGFDPDGYWKVGAPNSLNRREMAVLRELYLLRDAIARDENVPPFKIFTNNVMVSIFVNNPKILLTWRHERFITRYVRQWEMTC
jgi:ribonuclease D